LHEAAEPDTVEESQIDGPGEWARQWLKEGEMISKLRGRISSAHVIALAALFVALGGTAFAAATIGTNDIKDAAVTKKKLHKKSVSKKKIKTNAVNGKKVKDDSLTGDDIDEPT
jgi:quinol-cytochrome oxidoreductase complex cytochrome b subunit